jgi:hypothetical protein
MSRRQKDPLRPLTAEERAQLERWRRAHAESAAVVAHAKALLAVAGGHSYTDAARLAGRRSGDAVAQVVARFNRAGLAAVAPGHGVASRNPTLWPSRSASCARCGGSPIARPTGRRHGRWRRSSARSVRHPMGCRP